MRTKVSLGLAAAALLAVALVIAGGSAVADTVGRTIDVAWNGGPGGTPVGDDEAAQMVGGGCSYWKNYYCSCFIFCSGCRDIYAWDSTIIYNDFYGTMDFNPSCGGSCGSYWSGPHRCGTGITSTTISGTGP